MIFGKLVNVTIPRVRDFRGLEQKLIDQTGNMSIGFKEHIAFPESAEEDVRDLRIGGYDCYHRQEQRRGA